MLVSQSVFTMAAFALTAILFGVSINTEEKTTLSAVSWSATALMFCIAVCSFLRIGIELFSK